ncbi:MAG: winged helix-turn-helix transcriptional regulator [Spirochaetaceae bacterium]|nr:winged helix-turn-helix transcriptional regulator [Spirochaetaceae bacterium]
MSTPDIYNQLIAAVLRLLNQMNQMEKTPKSFGTDVQIHPSEIHTIVAIEDHPECNISELAKELGIAKPSVSEIVQKMETRGLIEKYKLRKNKKEVRLRLTPRGRTAYKGHAEYHAEMYSEIYSHMKKLPRKSLGEFKDALDQISSSLGTEIPEERKGKDK